MAMIEAARTTASTGVIWTIVVVMSLCTAFLVAATAVADVVQTRQNHRMRMMVSRMPGATELPSQRAARDMLTGQGEPRRPEPQDAAEAPTEPIPSQSGAPSRQAGDAARHTMPAQRSGESDRAQRAAAGGGNPERDEEDPGRRG